MFAGGIGCVLGGIGENYSSNALWNEDHWEIHPFRNDIAMFSNRDEKGEYVWIHRVRGYD